MWERINILKQVLSEFPRHVKIMIQAVNKDVTPDQIKYFKYLRYLYAQETGLSRDEAEAELIKQCAEQYNIVGDKVDLLVRKISEEDKHTAAWINERAGAFIQNQGIYIPRKNELFT